MLVLLFEGYSCNCSTHVLHVTEDDHVEILAVCRDTAVTKSPGAAQLVCPRLRKCGEGRVDRGLP